MNTEARIGVLIEGTIGDSLVLVPTLKMLQHCFAGSRIEVISFTNAQSISAEPVLGATFPEFDFSVISNSAGQNLFRRLGAWLGLTKLVRNHGLNILVYAFRPENKRASSRAKLHSLIVRLLTTAKMYGFKVDKWPQRNAKSGGVENLISKLLFERIVHSLGLKKQFAELDHKINVANNDIDASTLWLDAQFESEPKNYYAICVSGKTPSQQWPTERYLQVVEQLQQLYNLVPMFVGSPNEANQHTKLINNLGFGYTSAGLTIGQSSAVMQGAMFYLGNDTGPMHLAAALDLECVVVQSSRNLVGTWDPLGEKHILLQSAPDCAGCGAVECNLPEQLCLTNITVGQVLSACKNLLSSRY